MRLNPQHMPQSMAQLQRTAPFTARCARHFAQRSATMTQPSQLQRSVVAVLQGLGFPLEEEAVLEDAGGYSVDVLLHDSHVAVEVDGPSHFVRGADGLWPSGATLLKQRQLRALGYRLVSVPFWEWNELRSRAEQSTYLQQLLRRGAAD